MDEARLAEIEHVMLEINGLGLNDAMDLIAEVRRLKKAVNGAYEGGYENGESSAQADITGIITDPIAGDDASAEQILWELKNHLGLEVEDGVLPDHITVPRLLAFIDLTREPKDNG